MANILINTYRKDIPLFIDGRHILSSEGTTQGDPLAMAMYSISVTPLIASLQDPHVAQVWFSDDAMAGGTLRGLHDWWCKLNDLGFMYGYFPNAAKTWLIVKPERLDEAKQQFAGTGVSITVEGKRHLGAALGSRAFTEAYITEKVESWSRCVRRLVNIAKTHPHAAYAAFTHGLCSKWTYFVRTIPAISSLLEPLEDIISLQLLPALTGRSISDVERALFSLPVRLGGLGICDPKSHSDAEFDSSVKITSALVALIVQQELTFSIDTLEAQRSAKCEVVRMKHRAHDEVAATLCQSLPVGLQRIVALSSEKGASSWLSALPVEEHGFALHKGAFRDALCLRYGWLPSGLPTQCVCGQGFSVDHSMNCPTGGYPTLRHNELRDFTAAILSEVCTDVCVEPPLQSLSGETLTYATANREDGARLDVSAVGFWGGHHQRAFFDVKVFNPTASSYRATPVASLYRRFEKEKRRKYEQRIREVEMGSFTPLVFSTFGGISGCTSIFYKRLAYLLSLKREVPYSSVMSWLRCRIGFSLLRSAIACLRGARSHSGCPISHRALDLVLSEGRVPSP